MFGGRRQRPPNPPLTTSTANPSAATAAAAVFKRHESNSSLSQAAAAAALAARPTTPTRVADVQTKRTMRRSASIASSAASSDNHERPGLRRRGSSGSMTERTFRSPSPHRPGSSGSAHRQSQSLSYGASEEMPPVPALPRQAEIAAGQGQPHRRAASTGVSTTPLRLASQILGSEDAPSWFGASKLGDPRNVRRTDPAMASPPSSPPQTVRAAQQPETTRPSSRSSSINFSYPSRARVGSPPVSPIDARNSVEIPSGSALQEQPGGARQSQQPRKPKSQSKKRHPTTAGSAGPSDQVLVYDPNSRRMVPQAELWALEQAIRDTSGHPTTAKRKKQTPQRADSHLAKGTMGRTKINVPSVEPTKGVQNSNATSEVSTRTETQNSEELEEPAVKAIVSSPRMGTQGQGQHRTSDSNSRSLVSNVTAPSVPIRASNSWESSQQTVKRQPSVVKEEPELESDIEKQALKPMTETLDATPARPSVGNNGTGLGSYQGAREVANTAPLVEGPVTVSPTSPMGHRFAPEASQISNAVSREAPSQATFAPLRTSYAPEERAPSNSPVRQAHFGSVSNNLTVRHSPPPRSISPRKSALKHSSSPNRGASPSDDTSEASLAVNSREDPPIARKKSVRVSFDDGNTVVVGESASTNQSNSPVFASPQNAGRRPWYTSIGRNKKELPTLDDDEIMKPRPALPSFGSVRDRKPRELAQDEGERPLVRPIAERLHSLTITPKLSGDVADEGPLEPGTIGQSSDFAVGAILAREQEERSKIPANTSRYREPLPPVVTSVEGSGYLSDTPTWSDSELESQVMPEDANTKLLESSALEAPPVDAKPPAGSNEFVDTPEMTVPVISISQPTPLAVEKKSSAASFLLDVPGGFPQSDTDLSASEGSKNATTTADGPIEAAPTPLPVGHSTQSPPVEPSSDSESSIYSDAYEDLSEIEGDGFQSLNAVLGGPVVNKTNPDDFSREAAPQRSPTLQDYINPEIQVPASSLVAAPSTKSAEPTTHEKTEDEWERVKAYWRSLTADKRAQLEREATEDAGIEGDLEDVEVAQVPKKKKSVERRHSERKALAVHMAQQMVAQQQQKTEAQPAERNYMIQPGTKWAQENNIRSPMQTTLRSQPPQQSSAATGDEAPRLRKSMRANGPSANGAAQASRSRPFDTRPASVMAPSTTMQHQGTSEQSSHSHRPLLLKRRGSTSSESSFKRTRAGITGHVAGFRTSMRQTSTSVVQPEKSGKRFSLRSLSPPSSAFKRNADGPPVSMVTGLHLRQTLRDSSSERKKSSGVLRIPGFGSKKSGKRATGSQFSSRFGDSSDEDEGGKRGFRSRFEDSSDDEPSLTMVLPKTVPQPLRAQDSVASTALPEELEESEELPDKAAGVSAKQEQLQGQANSSATPRATESGSGRLPLSQTAPAVLTAGAGKSAERRNSVGSKRGSLMTALRRKKNGSSGKILRPEITESAARRDTKLERNLSQLRGIRSDEAEAEDDAEEDAVGQGQTISPPRSPRLQKRVVSLARSISNIDENGGGGTDISAALPLAASSEVEAASTGINDKEFIRSPLRRPSTRSGNLGTRTLSGLSGFGAGAGTGSQPGFLDRRTMSAGVMSVDAPSAAGTSSTKKKKFGALRRMFGLAD
ncbi:hypothetical protein B0T16DRAFT_22967 [Cercophora newfieldiana]|uniref:Uncharacterized protein n=1 Tax=Cercophora newfieldiana TaxID=92897 RepID=A0AA40D0D9_9PEZI|nr:hypothetical protein B0T16DRAFT_22967 [Cercophora newfieldiana]